MKYYLIFAGGILTGLGISWIAAHIIQRLLFPNENKKKYRIEHTYPKGFKIKKSRFGIFWVPALWIHTKYGLHGKTTSKELVFDSIEEAKEDLKLLLLDRKPIEE
jgi:hypothetical protein